MHWQHHCYIRLRELPHYFLRYPYPILQVPMDKITKGIDMLVPQLSDGLDGGHDAALAIMTTDTIPKEIY